MAGETSPNSSETPLSEPPAAPRPREWWAAALQGAGMLLSATALVWVVHLTVVPGPVQGVWALQVVLAVAAVLAGVWGAVYRRRTWTGPTRQLLTLLQQIRDGHASTEALNSVRGGPAVLVPLLQELLRDLKSQKAAVAELEAEIRQRVASRTDALERTIGSLRQQATRDGLTGLFNRRFLDQFLPQCVQRHLAERAELCLLMVDVDNFKVLNDTLGHAAGDALLKAVGQLIRSSTRGEDVAFRCGGDEFVILVPGCGEDAGRALAQRLTSLVDALAKTLHVAAPPRLSIGLTTLSKAATPTPQGLLDEADRVLYEVKGARKASRPGREGPPASLPPAPARPAGGPTRSSAA